MSDLFGNHIVGFPTRRLIFFSWFAIFHLSYLYITTTFYSSTRIGGMPPNVTMNISFDPLAEFDKKMTEYSLYYVYIGAAVFVSSFFQVRNIRKTCP